MFAVSKCNDMHKIEFLRSQLSQYISMDEIYSLETQWRFEAIKNNLIINDHLVKKLSEKLESLKSQS